MKYILGLLCNEVYFWDYMFGIIFLGLYFWDYIFGIALQWSIFWDCSAMKYSLGLLCSEVYFAIFRSPFLPLMCLSWVIASVVVCGAEIWTANIRRMPSGSHAGYQRATADNETQTSCLDPSLNYALFCLLFMSSTIWLYRSQGLFTVYSPVRNDVTRYS